VRLTAAAQAGKSGRAAQAKAFAQ